MHTLSTAIKKGNPKLVKELINQGFIVGPNDVQDLLIRTADCKNPEIQRLRLDISQLFIDVQTKKPMSLNKVQSLSYNHSLNPMGTIQQIENKFIELCSLWETGLTN